MQHGFEECHYTGDARYRPANTMLFTINSCHRRVGAKSTPYTKCTVHRLTVCWIYLAHNSYISQRSLYFDSDITRPTGNAHSPLEHPATSLASGMGMRDGHGVC